MAKSQLVNAFGIEKIKLFIALALGAGQKLFQIDTNADGRISSGEGIMAAMSLGGSVMQLGPLWPDVKAEGGDLTESEKDEIVEYVIGLELMPGAKRPEIEAQIDDTLRALNYNINFVNRSRRRFQSQG
jgi:hypothetical protein